MQGSAAVAAALVDFDPLIAGLLLRLVVRELGGPDGRGVPELQSFLRGLHVDGGSSKTTIEWKADFAETERMRSLGLALAELLEPPADQAAEQRF